VQADANSNAAAGKAQSPSAASRPREERPWVAERWGNDRDAPETKWGQDFDRGSKWADDERRERAPPANIRREHAR
jgi:hypothetical protein